MSEKYCQLTIFSLVQYDAEAEMHYGFGPPQRKINNKNKSFIFIFYFNYYFPNEGINGQR